MRNLFVYLILVLGCSVGVCGEDVTLNRKAKGFKGIWYGCQPTGDEYVYKYSGGLGTYCAKHRPY